MHEYDDNYGTCTDTYATLRITSDKLSIEEISEALKQSPTRSIRKGELRSGRASLKKSLLYVQRLVLLHKRTIYIPRLPSPPRLNN